MDYAAALAWLDQHRNREAIAGRFDDLTLEPTEVLLHALADPHLAVPVIHITGTNGKGSVARMVASLLRAHGLRVGTYTSPHLHRVNERLAIDLEEIDDERFAHLLGELRDLLGVVAVEPSYFELLTVAAFSWFAQEAVDVAVVEVGLLGRYDATNVVRSQVAVVTNVAADHTDGVGDWRRAIAWEKAGIIKPTSLAVIGETSPELQDVFAEEPAAGRWVRDRDFGVAAAAPAIGGRVVDLWTPSGAVEELYLPLHGEHQVDNAALAVAAVEAFFGRGADDEVLREGIAAVTVPGRFEVVRRHPLVVLDGAHNPAAAAAAAATFEEEFLVDGPRILVIGMLGGRPPGEMVDAFAAASLDAVVACRATSPRALAAEEVAAAATRRGLRADAVPDPAAALERACALAGEDGAVLASGSLYVVGALRDHPRLLP